MNAPEPQHWDEKLAQEVLELRVALILAYPGGALATAVLSQLLPYSFGFVVGGILWFGAVSMLIARVKDLRCSRCGREPFEGVGDRSFELYLREKCPHCGQLFSFAPFVDMADRAKRESKDVQ